MPLIAPFSDCPTIAVIRGVSECKDAAVQGDLPVTRGGWSRGRRSGLERLAQGGRCRAHDSKSEKQRRETYEGVPGDSRTFHHSQLRSLVPVHFVRSVIGDVGPATIPLCRTVALSPGELRQVQQGDSGIARISGDPRHGGMCLALVMATSPPRYDSIADWYIEFTRRWEERPNALLPDDVVGQRILDQGCGYGVA